MVGEHLRPRLPSWPNGTRLIGAVHGIGLYLGWSSSATARRSSRPTEETAAICERMRELGVIVQPTGDRMNVLKIKPPLCLSSRSADFFVDTLDRVLTTGW